MDTTTQSAAAVIIAELERGTDRHDVPVEGGRVVWRRFGSGPPLVLLHGGHGSWLHWARNIRALAPHYEVLVPDLPGYGDSDSPPQPTFDALIEMTRQSLAALVAPEAPLRMAGFSFGGLVASCLTARRGHVAQLALLGAGGHGGARQPRGELKIWRTASDRGDHAAVAAVMRHNLLMHMLHDPASVDELALRIHTDACVATRFRSRAISRAGQLAQWLDQYRGPLFLAWGEHDVTAVPQDALAAMSQGHDHCKSWIVPGSGHWLQYERADELNHALLAWLNANAKNLEST